VCALVRLEKPASTCRHRSFPAFTDPKEYLAKRDKLLCGMPDAAKTLIDGLQPSTRTDGTAERHPVAILNKLSNRDKHRAPHLTNTYSRDTKFVIDYPRGPFEMVLNGPLYSDADAILPFVPRPFQRGMNVNARGALDIAFKERQLGEGHPVEKVLRDCIEFIEKQVIPRLKPFFG
jgi:hypothetical protein